MKRRRVNSAATYSLAACIVPSLRKIEPQLAQCNFLFQSGLDGTGQSRRASTSLS